MNNDNTTPKPIQPEQPSHEGLDGAACSPVFAILERIPIGERIQRGDWWYYKHIGCWIRVDYPPKNWLGMTQKVTKYHAPFYRVTGLNNLLENAQTDTPPNGGCVQ